VDAVDPYGFERAKSLLKSLNEDAQHLLAAGATPELSHNPPLTPSCTVESPIPGGLSLSPAETAYLGRFVDEFVASLPPSKRPLFRSGHRLSSAEFTYLTSTLSATQIAERGLRLAGPPPSGPSPPSLTDLVTLAQAWHFVDPVLTEVCCDMALYGQHLGFDGPRPEPSASPRVPNMFKAGSPQEKLAKQKVDADIAKGRSTGYFPDLPPGCPFAVPMGLVPKGSSPDPDFTDADSHRLIRNWSDPRLTARGSVTANVDKIKSSMMTPVHVLRSFHKAILAAKKKGTHQSEPSIHKSVQRSRGAILACNHRKTSW